MKVYVCWKEIGNIQDTLIRIYQKEEDAKAWVGTNTTTKWYDEMEVE